VDRCPLAAVGIWRSPTRAQHGLSHNLSLTQSAAGFSAAATGGWIVAMDGAHLGEDFRLAEGSSVIGAAFEADVVVTSPGMSTKHVRMTCFGTGAEIEDIGGKGGVLLNGEPVTNAPVVDGDDLRFGGVRFIFRSAARFQPGYVPNLRPRPATPPVQTVLKRRYVTGWLMPNTGPLAGRDYRLVRGRNHIGSAADIEVNLIAAELPNVACVIDCETGRAVISRPAKKPHNSIRLAVNGSDVKTEATLSDSDLLFIGDHEFYVKWF